MGGGQYPQMYPHFDGRALGEDWRAFGDAAYRPGEPLRFSYFDRKPGSYATGLSGYENIETNIMNS